MHTVMLIFCKETDSIDLDLKDVTRLPVFLCIIINNIAKIILNFQFDSLQFDSPEQSLKHISSNKYFNLIFFFNFNIKKMTASFYVYF